MARRVALMHAAIEVTMLEIGPRPTINLFVVVLALISAVVVSIGQALPPAPLPASASVTEFSAERAAQHIEAIAKQPRPTGSAANAAAREYILEQLGKLGLEAQTQRVGDLESVVARIAGTRSSEAILLTAHLDSVAESPGAADDGSGVAVLLETARALVSGAPSPNTVMFLFTDLEEGGTIGAGEFIARHPWARDVRIVIGLDAGGLRGPGVLSATSAQNGWLIRQVAQADRHLVGSSAINALAESGTDFGLRFKPAGFSGYAFDLYWDRRIHTPEDSIANLSLSSLQHQGYHALSLARHLSRLDSPEDPREPDAVYFSVLRLATVVYPYSWSIPLAVAVAGIFCGVLIFGLSRRILTWGGLGYGAFVLLVGLIIAPMPGLLLGGLAPGVPLGIVGSSFDTPSEVGVAALSALVLIIIWYSLARRFKSASAQDLTMGALVAMVIGMVGTSVILPALSFAFTWPLLFSLLASTNWFYRLARGSNSKTVVPGLLLSGVASILVLTPTILLGLFDQMPLTLVLLGVLCGYLAPLIHFLLGGAREHLERTQEQR